MSTNSIKISAWEEKLLSCVLTERNFTASSHFLLVKHAMVKDEKLNAGKTVLRTSSFVDLSSFSGRKNLMMEKMLIMCDSARCHGSTEGRMTSL